MSAAASPTTPDEGQRRRPDRPVGYSSLTVEARRSSPGRLGQGTYRIFDADLHHQYPSHEALAVYLPEGSPPPYYGGGTGIPNPRGAYRMDAIPPGGGVEGSDPAFVVSDHLDRYDIEYAVLNPGSLLGLGGLPDVDYAAAIARATNDWTINDWFPVDERFLGSIFIAPRDPEQAAAEIRRVGSNPRMVQVTTTSAPCLLGNQFMHPVYEACDELGLAFNHHVGGHEHGLNHGTYPSGAPTSFMEHHIRMCVPGIQPLATLLTARQQMAGLVAESATQRITLLLSVGGGFNPAPATTIAKQE